MNKHTSLYEQMLLSTNLNLILTQTCFVFPADNKKDSQILFKTLPGIEENKWVKSSYHAPILDKIFLSFKTNTPHIS